MSETSEITRPLIEALNETGGMALRMNSGKVKVARGFVQLHEEGTADILFFHKLSATGIPFTSNICWIETKHPRGHTHKDRAEKQAEFRAKVEALGHRYIRVESVRQGLDEALQ